MLKEVPDDRLGLRYINLISVILVRLLVVYGRCHFCMCCRAAESRGNLLLLLIPSQAGCLYMAS